ncbi:hypothetical protein BH09ACT8_BH09ACT8_60040 [soil metagenome]
MSRSATAVQLGQQQYAGGEHRFRDVGQIASITQTKETPTEELWTPDGAVGELPPIDGAFYGDFGMAPTYQASASRTS